MSETATFFQGRDNWGILGLLEAGAPLTSAQLSTITRVRIELSGGTVVDYEDTPAAFEWPMGGVYLDEAVSGIGVNLAETDLEPFTDESARLVIFGPDHPNGLVWTESLSVALKA
jgi:hypothetical protein